MTYDELTADLPEDIAQAFILCPMYINADSLDMETFIETVYQRPVTVANYKSVAQLFRSWYKQTYPDEYQDPPTESEMVAPGWGGARYRPPGSQPPGPAPRSPAGARVKLTFRLDPDLHRHASAYAQSHALSLSDALNQLIDKALQ